MRHRRVITWTLALAFCAGAPTRAQPAPPRFDRLDGRDGLPHNTVQVLLQDTEGFLWAGTPEGLARYDGLGFSVLRHDPERPGSLPSNTVQALLEDAGGDLWVGTAGGVARLSRRTGAVVRYPLDGLPAPDVCALVRGPDEAVWAATYNGPRFRYDRDADRFVAAPSLPAPVSAESDLLLAATPGGVLWGVEHPAAPPSRLFRFDAGTFHPVALPTQGWIERFYAAPSGTLWVSTPGLDLRSGGLPIRSLPPLPGGRTYTEVAASAFLETRDGALWIGAGDGLYRYAPVTDTIEWHAPDPSGDPLRNFVLALLEDRAGAVWVGTRSGLYRYDPHRLPFGHLGPGAGLPDDLGAVMAIHEHADGGLWLGGLGGGLVRLDRVTGTATRFRHRPGDAHSLPSDHVWAIHATPDGALWIGTDGGLALLDPAAGRVRRVALPPAGPFGHRHVYALATDGAGRVWAGGSSLLFALDEATGRLVRTVDLRQIGPSFALQALHADRQGRLWLGTEKRGLWTFDPASGRLDPASALPAHATVWAIHAGRDGALWLGTDAGLARLDPASDALTRLTAPEHPASVYSVAEDEAGRIWLGTGRGLSRFDPHTRRFRPYDASDGVPEVEFNRRAAARGAGGALYFGGLDGVTAFDPSAALGDAPPPPVVLTRVHRAGRGDGAVLDPRHLGPEGLRLSRRDLTVTFEFVALGFTNPARNRYRYRLEGFDADWVEAGTERAARYTNLPPGRYTFRVRAASADGAWNETGAALAVAVAAPYWQTAWFRLLALALAAGLLAGAHRLRVAHLLRIERVRGRIASDLHDEVGSRLASLALVSEVVTRRADLPARERRQLDEAARTARQLAGDLRDVVWLANPRFDSLGDLTEKMRATAEALLDGIPHRFVCPDAGVTRPLDMEHRRQLFLFYREALRNVVRHAGASRVEIRLERQPEGLLLEVADDGAGFDPAAAREATGLASLHERARALGGRVEIESAPGAGTTVRLRVPTRRALGARMAVFRDGRRRG